MIRTLDHVSFLVDRLDDAVASYSALFGGLLPLHYEDEDRSAARFQLANMALVLVAPRTGAGGQTDEGSLAGRRPGPLALGFAVEDLGKTRRLFENRGLPSSEPRAVHAENWPSGASPVLSTLDPEATHGIAVSLVSGVEAHHAMSDGGLGLASAVSALDHVVVRTPAPERAVALYGARLGLDMRLDRTNPAWNARLLFFRCGGVTVEIAHDLKQGAGDGPDELWGCSWRVDDIEAAHVRLAQAGFSLSEIRTGRRPKTRVFSVRGDKLFAPTLILSLETEALPRARAS